MDSMALSLLKMTVPPYRHTARGHLLSLRPSARPAGADRLRRSGANGESAACADDGGDMLYTHDGTWASFSFRIPIAMREMTKAMYDAPEAARLAHRVGVR
jgi:hypothetical protein